jgi:hypothetical protein
VSVWLKNADSCELADDAGALTALFSLDKGLAPLEVVADHPSASTALYSALTLSSALLLGRRGGTLMHAGAVVSPAGETWLVVGDTHCGKTSTCAGLLSTGWRLLADDHIVLRPERRGGATADGWPRTTHLDSGWEFGEPTGMRRPVDLFVEWPSPLLNNPPVTGVVFPRVEAEQPTLATPVVASDAFGRLVRQSPWLMVDTAVVSSLSALLTRIAALPAYELRLGLDTFADGNALARRFPQVKI